MLPSLPYKIISVRLYFIPVHTRVPLKFGPETLTSVTCVRVAMRVADERGATAQGWGETPLSVQWVWPSAKPYAPRQEALKQFCCDLARAWAAFEPRGHALEAGWRFNEEQLPPLHRARSAEIAETGSTGAEPMPWLAALVCNSAFDLALHDACGKLLDLPVYETYNPQWLSGDLASFLEPVATISFAGKYPADFLRETPQRRLRAWHLVGGLDLLDSAELTGAEPDDGYPVTLADWVQRDGLKCLKVKLRGNDEAWDNARMLAVGRIALTYEVDWLSADFNCTVTDPAYVNAILDRLREDAPRIYARVLYVEQPFPYDLETHPIDVRSVSARKPLFLDESAHDWRLIRLGRELGWSGVALKTCKTQTGAILSACWARAHGMELMVQDLTNPMLAQIPHVLLAGHAGTIMGVETNSMQFYPDASAAEAAVHPGIYRRTDGAVDLGTIRGTGFGYRLEEMSRALPPPHLQIG